MPAHEVKTVSVKLDNDMRDRIRILADAKKRTTQWVMQQAIEQYVKREEEREMFRKETLQAWEEYQETGLHVTAEEVTDWLETWGELDEKAAPVCHR